MRTASLGNSSSSAPRATPPGSQPIPVPNGAKPAGLVPSHGTPSVPPSKARTIHPLPHTAPADATNQAPSKAPPPPATQPINVSSHSPIAFATNVGVCPNCHTCYSGAAFERAKTAGACPQCKVSVVKLVAPPQPPSVPQCQSASSSQHPEPPPARAGFEQPPPQTTPPNTQPKQEDRVLLQLGTKDVTRQCTVDTRLRLVSAFSGETLCWPGPTHEKNGWTLDGAKWTVDDILNGSKMLKVIDGKVNKEELFNPSAVLYRGQPIVAHGNLKLIECVDVKRRDEVAIMFGDRRLPYQGEPCEPKPECDLDSVSSPDTPTPRTPSPR